MIVSDTNLIVYLLTKTPFTSDAESVYSIDPEWHAPHLWRSEFRNFLWTMLRRKIMSLPVVLQLMERAESIVLGSKANASSETILRLAAESGCSPYDCEFVVLALQLECPLVTADAALLKAFPDFAVSPDEFVRMSN